MDQDLVAYLEQRFSSFDERFSSLDQRVEQQIQALRKETVQGFAKVDQRLETIETNVRGAYVAIEDLRDEVRLVAEGVASVNERLDRHEENESRRFSDMESLLRQSYEDLDTRVRKLEGFG